MRTWLRVGVMVAAVGGVVAGARAQEVQAGLAPGVQTGQAPQAVARPEGTVTGTVICADTQMPARFAAVMLIPVEMAQEHSGDRHAPFFGGGSARTDLQGNFAMQNVAVGDYYVAATATGYVSMDMVRLAEAAGAGESSALAALPQVHVAAGGNSNVSVSLNRGAVIAGKLVWDDGSPATGVQVSALLQTDATSSAQATRGSVMLGFGGGGSGYGMTDDRGQFRLTGLMAGTYLIRASVEAPSSGTSTRGFMRGFPLVMYAPGKIRKTDAKAVTVGAAEERDDVGFTLNLQALHTVSGHVAVVSGPSIESGSVRVVDTTDSTLSRTAQVSPDGSFTLTYVPAGTYTLTATGSTTPATSFGGYTRGGGRSGSSNSSATFQPFSESLSVTDGDVTGLGIELTPGSAK